VIDHLTLTVRDLARSRTFYTQTLAPLGYSVRMEFGLGGSKQACGFGDEAKPYFWLKEGDPPTQPLHIAFMAKERRAVDAFHAAALAAGATDNGKPGVREHYHPNCYGAFVFDPDGHPIEAVCHTPPTAARAQGGHGPGLIGQ
jgi:catechol 2,3-dioxygenase-like lactoylglutathione lyase family enzyme